MVETGTVYSLKELGNKFLAFAQTSDSSTQAWELRQNKLDSFYGATLAVPLNDWEDGGVTPHFYISLCFRQISPSSYGSWLWGEDYYHAESYNHILEDANYVYTRATKYGGGNGGENVFKDSGQILQVGLHTTFDDNLWMCEQGNVTCEAEAEAQTGGPNLLPGRLIMYPKEPGQDPTETTIIMPNYPGTGCPWFTFSNDNEENFNFSSGGATYWFTRSNYNATITICYHGTVDVYQTMVFGRLENVHNGTHLIPLYIAGGNQALKEDVYVYTPVMPDAKPTAVGGNSFYLNILNAGLSNSNPLHPTKFNGATMSNFRVLSSDGRWKNIYAHIQGAAVLADPTCKDEVTSWHVMLGDVNNNIATLHSALPFCSGYINYFKDLYTITTPLTQYKSEALYNSIMPVLNQFSGGDVDYDERGIVGSLVDCYGYYSRTLPYGKIETDDNVTDTVLSIPCGWEGRQFHYPTQHGMVTAEDSQNLVNKAVQKSLDGIIMDRFIIDYK